MEYTKRVAKWEWERGVLRVLNQTAAYEATEVLGSSVRQGGWVPETNGALKISVLKNVKIIKKKLYIK